MGVAGADGAGTGEEGGALGDGAGDGEGSAGHAPPSCFFRVVMSVTPLSSTSFDSWFGAHSSADWPTMSIVVTTSCPQGSAVHFASTLASLRTSTCGTR